MCSDCLWQCQFTTFHMRTVRHSHPPLSHAPVLPSGLDEVRSILSACGKSAVLGPLEENEEEDDEDDDEDDGSSSKGGAMVAALEQAMAGMAVTR